MQRQICVRCQKGSRIAKLVAIDNNIGILCGTCHSEFEKIEDFYKIPEQDKMEAFRQFCKSGLIVKYRDEESIAYEESRLTESIASVGGW